LEEILFFLFPLIFNWLVFISDHRTFQIRLRDISILNNSGFGAWFKSIEAFLPHRAWNFGLNPNLSFIFKNGNALSVNYEYEFFRINNPEPISQSAGAWFISLTTRL
jgi:hypothetical protein